MKVIEKIAFHIEQLGVYTGTNPESVKFREEHIIQINKIAQDYLPQVQGFSNTRVMYAASTVDRVVIHTNYHMLNHMGEPMGTRECEIVVLPRLCGFRLVLNRGFSAGRMHLIDSVFSDALNTELPQSAEVLTERIQEILNRAKSKPRPGTRDLSCFEAIIAIQVVLSEHSND